MKRTFLLFSFLIFSVFNAFSQTGNFINNLDSFTVTYSEMINFNSDSQIVYETYVDTLDPVKQTETYYNVVTTETKEVFLYPGKIGRDTVIPCEFTYIKKGRVYHRSGQIVRVYQQWTNEPGGDNVVISRTLEYYIIGDNRMRYELDEYYFYKEIYDSNTIQPAGLFKWFKRKPEYVLNITKVFPATN